MIAESTRGRFFSAFVDDEADLLTPAFVDDDTGELECGVTNPARRSFISRSTSSIVRLSFFCRFNLCSAPGLNASLSRSLADLYVADSGPFDPLPEAIAFDVDFLSDFCTILVDPRLSPFRTVSTSLAVVGRPSSFSSRCELSPFLFPSPKILASSIPVETSSS